MLRRACDELLVSLALPPLFQHVASFVLAELMPFRGPEALETISVAMVLVHLLVATPLALLALPGAWGLVRALPTAPPGVALAARVLAGAVAVLVVLALLARFVGFLPFQVLREATDVSRLGLGLACALLLLIGHARAPRWLLGATTLAAIVALICHVANHGAERLDHELLLGAHSVAAALLGSSLLVVRRSLV